MNALKPCAGMLLVASLLLVNSTPRAQGLDPERLREMLLQRIGQGAYAQPPSAVPSPMAQTSEAALAEQLAAWPSAKGPFVVERFRDGFAINGERVLDPEGTIVQYAVDGVTGDAAYLMRAQADQYLIKVMRHGGVAPLTLGSAARAGGQWTVETTTGVRAAGTRLNLTPRGFIVARDNALFRYSAGAGLRAHALPETHTLAAHQNGDVGATGWLLLEKRADTKEQEGGLLAQGSLGELLGTFKQLGTVLGVTKSDSDYALYNLDTRKLLPIGISLGENNTNLLSRCRTRNRWIAQCDRLDSVASLYGQDGYPNRSHYFWRVSWFDTPRGAVAVVMEDGITRIDAIDLGSERRVNVFQRALGIGNWSTAKQPDGRVQVKAQLGLESATQDDVAGLFDAAVTQTAQR